MNRRAYLASGLVVTIGGCMDGSDGDSADDGSSDDASEQEATGPIEPESGETVDDFSDIDAWELVAGAVARDEDRAIVGDSCARLENRESDEQARIAYEFDEPLDCRRHSPGLAIAADESMAPLLQLFDDGGGHVTFRATIEADVELLRPPFGIQHADDVDLGAITRLEIAHVAGEEIERHLWIDDLHFVARPETGVVTLQFDGGHESVYENGLPITEEYGYPATVFVPTGRVREEADHDGEALAETQLEELDDAGWTIASHTARSRPLTDLEDDERREEIEDAVEWLESEGYDDGTRYVAYPSGRYDQAGLEAVRGVHEFGFVGRYPCQGEPAEPLLCSRVLEPEPEEVEEVLDRAATYGGITALGWGRLEDESLESFEITVEVLSELETEGDLEVVTPQELDQRYSH
ncbi:polysaccharide deacetylase family protein [Natrarchaeobaculum sulfurireducens]|nr:polysaccharide deacetylase family protein [Natrarchaeobaculum sulfurireducens]